MNAEDTVDWESWEVEKPPPDFVERVMDAALAASREPPLARRSRRPTRVTGRLAAALAVGSLAVLAMIAPQRRRANREDAKQVTSDRATGRARPAESATANSMANIAAQPMRLAAGTVIDRKLRDSVRDRIVPRLEQEGVVRDPHTGLTIPTPSSGPAHNLSREYLQSRIREDFYPLAMACYTSALSREPKLRGKIVVDFMIVGDAKVGGIVDQAKINDRTDIGDAEFTGCIRESMLSMVFAPPDDGGWVSVSYPFQFSPDDEAPADD